MIKMYNTNINVVAGIPDLSLITELLKYSVRNGKISVPKNTINNLCNRYVIRTQKSMTRFIEAINKSFNLYDNEDHQNLFLGIIKSDHFDALKPFILFFQMGINNSLFYDITVNVYHKQYFEGKTQSRVEDYLAYLYFQRENHPEIKKWSDATIKIIASKYLTFLKKIGLLEGQLHKKIRSVTLDDPIVVGLVYLIKSLNDDSLNFFENKYFPLFLMSKELFLKQVKNIAKADYFEIRTLGYDLRIDLKYSYQEIVDVLIKNYRSKVQ